MKRREFLKLIGAGVSMMSLPANLFADDNDDYKAIVVLYQAGGNDSMNMFIPTTDYDVYAEIRENLKINNEELTLNTDDDGNLDLSTNPYEVDSKDLRDSYLKGFYKHDNFDVATNALMPEIAHLINSGNIAVVLNAGNLIMPSTKDELLNDIKPTPPFLFAHNHQTKLALNGEASKLDYTGWAGRVYDKLKGINNGSIYGMNISLNDVTHLFEADNNYLVIPPKSPLTYNRVNRDLYTNLTSDNHFGNLYNTMINHSFDMQDILVDDWNNNSPSWDTKNAYGLDLFTLPDNDTLSSNGSVSISSSLSDQLEAVAKWAYIGKNKGLKKQIFFVKHNGYDTHSNQLYQHSKLLRELSMAVGDFYLALKDMDMQNDVTLFNVSDFGRSSGDNGDGTDHAWGGHYFVLGGAVNGGQYGKMPDLHLGSDDDITKKGRLIPTTSYTQYYATVLEWFGIDDVESILPEIGNFTEQNLGFI